jgi:hypothetical protein
MTTSLRFGMLETVYTGDETIEKIEETVSVYNKETEEHEEVVRQRQVSHFSTATCKDEKCGRGVAHSEPCFIDTWTENGTVYCDSCGKCIRYERKMADRRGELESLK